MNVFTLKSLPWLLGGVGVLAVAAGLMIGLALSGNSTQATAQIPHNALTESLPITHPVDASLAPAAPEFATVVESDGGEPAVSEQQSRTPANIRIEPEEDWNPVKTQHTFTVTVTDAGNAPVAGADVELILNRFSGAVDAEGNTIFSVGDIVSIDDGEKVDNTFGTVTTNANGQATFTITSTREGDTDVTAYAPGILDADKHKVFAVKHWIDMDVICPPETATNQAGNPHTMTITVFRASAGMDVDGYPAAPEPDQAVAWRITDDSPAARLVNVETTTDSQGRATATLEQVTPAPGDNEVTISVVDADNRPMFNCTIVKQWIAGQLGVTKTASAERVNIGETVTFTIDVQNLNEAGSLTNVNITDAFPFDGFETNDPTDWQVLTLSAGDSETFTITARAIATGTFTNEVEARSIEDEGPATSDATVTVVAPDVTVSKTVEPQRILVNDQATFTIRITNNDQNAAANNLRIRDVLDSGLSLIPDSSNLPRTIDQLPAGDYVEYTVTVQADVAGTLGNEVTVDWAERVPSGLPEAFARATVDVLTPDISLEKTTTDGDLLFTGDQGTYTITVTNTGEAELTNVRITDTIPSNLSYVRSSDSGTTSTNADGDVMVSWPAVTLAVGETIDRTVTLRAETACECVNTAEVTTAQGPEATDTQDITIFSATGGNITITENTNALMRVGEEVTFSATVSNENDRTPMTEVQVSIEVSDHFGIDTDSLPAGATVSGNTVTFVQIPSLAPLASSDPGQFTITVEALPLPSGVLRQSGTATAYLQYAEFEDPLIHRAGVTIVRQAQ